MSKMKLSLCASFLLVGTLSLKAQDPYEEGANVISVGVGVGSSIGHFTYGSQTPAINFQYERGITEIDDIPGVVSIGGYFGVKNFKYEGKYYGYRYKEKWNYKIVGVRGAFHYTGLDADDIDLYAGVMLSYYIVTYNFEYIDPYDPNYYDPYYFNGSYGSSVGTSYYVGGRYLFSQNFGAFVELGYGVSYLSVGGIVKF